MFPSRFPSFNIYEFFFFFLVDFDLISTIFLFQHSMVYFFHHYELPVILQQDQFHQLLVRTQARENRQANQQATTTNPLSARITQLLSVVRSSATTQTSTTISQVATSTSTNTTTTSTVGTSAQPVTSTHSSQTVPSPVETAEVQTPGVVLTAAASSQTIETPSSRPSGGPDFPWWFEWGEAKRCLLDKILDVFAGCTVAHTHTHYLLIFLMSYLYFSICKYKKWLLLKMLFKVYVYIFVNIFSIGGWNIMLVFNYF